MAKNSFWAMISRMKYILRWGLMRNTYPENLSQHSFDTAVIAHCLAVIHNKRLGGQLDPGKVVLAALYHDCGEILTGDMPTPVKYFDPPLRSSYRRVEESANQKLLSMLPEDFADEYRPLLCGAPGDGQWKEIVCLVKAADKLCAYIKCVEELKSSNREFLKAKEATWFSLCALDSPEVKIFIDEFLPTFELSLDELD